MKQYFVFDKVAGHYFVTVRNRLLLLLLFSIIGKLIQNYFALRYITVNIDFLIAVCTCRVRQPNPRLIMLN